MQIGDKVRYVGNAHPFLRGETVKIVAVLKGYLIDPDEAAVISDNAALEAAGGINEAEDMVEVAPYVEGRVSFVTSDARLSDLAAVE